MTFSEILDRVGSMGPFQYLHVTLLALPILGIANHNLLQIFTATTPVHHCRPPPNASLGPWVLPLGPNGKPEKCLRFVHLPNASLPNDTQRATEPCLDGWIYNSTRDTIVTEWDLVCSSNKLKEMAQSVFMAGILVGGPVFGELSDRWVPESIRWLVLSGKFSKALKTLQRVATFNGKKEEGKKLTVEDLKFNLQKDITSAKIKYGLSDLFRVSILRRVTFCLSLAWFSTGFAYYSLAMGVEEFGVNIYILQIIFGGVDIPAKFITILSISYLGRRITQGFLLLLAGGAILALIFVSSEMELLRTALAVFGKGCLSGSFSCLFLYTSELYPTVLRQTGMGVSNVWARVGSMIAPLVKITGELQPFIPNVIFGSTALLGGSAAFFLLETLNRPLPETIEDIQDWHQQTKKTKQEPEAEKASQTIPLKSGA
ncbi:organic anion transporter 3 isoform X3 [Arvicanthis niloticus]|uniref:organic anion transporter 3 isoform X3 n=1 Tax=Arvicanthis niloticus TaxID=61156 RepID=UPI00403CAFC8